MDEALPRTDERDSVLVGIREEQAEGEFGWVGKQEKSRKNSGSLRDGSDSRPRRT